LLNVPQVIEATLEAQHEGCDAAVINDALDGGLTEAKEVMDIPTIAISKATLTYALQLGQKFGVVTPQERGFVNGFYSLLRKYGLENHMMGGNAVRGMAIPLDVAVTEGMKNPQLIVRAVKETATELINEGAEVIIIGCAIAGPICSEFGLTTLLDGKVPVLDPVAIGFKIAEIMVDLRKSLSLPTTSGLSTYAKIPKDDLNLIRKKFCLTVIE
jgi:allantoin racemase